MTSFARLSYLERGAVLLSLLQKYPNKENQTNYNKWLASAKPTPNEMQTVLRLSKRQAVEVG